jgi:hypothetical protein
MVTHVWRESGCVVLVLPQQCRQLVLNVAHDVPMADHLGINKTKARILKYYYWPGASSRWQTTARPVRSARGNQISADGEEHSVSCASRKLKPRENRSSSLRSSIGDSKHQNADHEGPDLKLRREGCDEKY